MAASDPIEAPPRDPDLLRRWAHKHGIEAMLHLAAIGAPEAPLPDYFRGGRNVRLTFLETMAAPAGLLGSLGKLLHDAVLERLHAFAEARVVALGADQAFSSVVTPADPLLASFVEWLAAGLGDVPSTPRMLGRHRPGGVSLLHTPRPYLTYQEEDLYAPAHASVQIVRLPLMGWEATPARLLWWQDRKASSLPPPAALQRAAFEAFIRFVCGGLEPTERDRLRQILVTPGWSYVLQELDGELDALELRQPDLEATRVAFRIGGVAPGLRVEPVLQKQRKDGGFSSGSKLEWRELSERGAHLPAEDLQVLRAYYDPLHNNAGPSSRKDHKAVFACLLALRGHPRVFYDQPGQPPATLQSATATLRFVEDALSHIEPKFDLGPLTLSPQELAAAARDGEHVVVQVPDQPAHIILAVLKPALAAVARAFASAHVPVAPQAKEELLARLAPLQPVLDMQWPASWVGPLKHADVQFVVRLEPLQTGALVVNIAVRPLASGPLWPPGQGPSVVLGGIYQQRHSVQRDFAAEEATAQTWIARLNLAHLPAEGPYHFTIEAGDAVFDWLAHLQAVQSEAQLQVEWPKQGALRFGGSLARSDLRLRVNTHRDYFSLEGGGQTEAGAEVPLAQLLTAAREGRKYVLIQGRKFVKLAQDLRELLALAQGELDEPTGGLNLGRAEAAAFFGLLQDPEQVQADRAFERFRARLAERNDVTPQIGPTLAAVLRPYQWEGVQFLCRLAHWGAGAVLADEMGLGKTLQALAVLEHRSTLGPALVVAPTSVGFNWMQEAARFAPGLKLTAYRDDARARHLAQLGPNDVLVTSYAIAVRDQEALSQIHFATLVIDEAQAIKNASTERARALQSLVAHWKLALTGTPLENHLSELWSLFHTVLPGLLGSWQRFRAVFAVPIERYGDTQRRSRLAQIIRPYMLRRRKSEVAQELPPRTEVVRKVTLSPIESRYYESFRAATLAALDKRRETGPEDAPDVRMMLLAALTRMRQLACHPRLVHPEAGPSSAKLEALVRLALELRDNGSRALIFSQFRSFLDLVQPQLEATGLTLLRLDGTTPAAQREALVQQFQAGEADAFLISLKAGGFGLNLTAADVVIHLDPWWNPAVEDQASDRAHRIGQQRPVTVVRLVAEDTVEESVLALHAEKRRLVAGVLEGTDVAGVVSVNELIGLIQQ